MLSAVDVQIIWVTSLVEGTLNDQDSGNYHANL